MEAEHFNQLSPAEAERLALLLEELGEAQQAIGKILRHGYPSTSPFDATQTSNRDNLEKELGDVMAAVSIMTTAGDLTMENIETCAERKINKVGQWLHHNKVVG